jgi:hypothetical protein
MGVWPETSVFFGTGGELSFGINDLASFRGDLKEVARLILGNYRGATSADGSIRKINGRQVLATACGLLIT